MAFLQADVPFETVPLSASNARTVAGVQAAANQAIKILELLVSFDGATSTNAPALVEFMRCNFGANAPGTNSTTVTPVKRDTGRAETIQTTAAKNWTTEPTTLTLDQSALVAQFNGLYHYILPFASPIIVPGGQGYVVRVNSPNTVNCTGKLVFEE